MVAQIGETALTPAQRSRRHRERHAVQAVALPGALYARLRDVATCRGYTMPETVEAGLDALEKKPPGRK